MEDLDFPLIKGTQNERAPPPPTRRKSFSKSSFIHHDMKTAPFWDCCKTCGTAFNPNGKATLPHPPTASSCTCPSPPPKIGYKQTPCTLPPQHQRGSSSLQKSPERVSGQRLRFSPSSEWRRLPPRLTSGQQRCQHPGVLGPAHAHVRTLLEPFRVLVIFWQGPAGTVWLPQGRREERTLL